MPASSVHSFQLPHLPAALSLGHKYRTWYLIFAESHRTADSREIARLDAPSLAPRTPGPRHWSPRPRFWFDPRARSGWEHAGAPTLLDLLMALELHEAPLFAVVDHETEAGACKVEVLIPEHKLAHHCEGCGRWEVGGEDALRWYMVCADALPSYLCPSCHAKDWFGARAIRHLKRIVYTSSFF
ncbi:hypothetical protein B0H16DRAFT_1527866 [Mycena metata]|uniref:Uncharacterized protein n=1 Tax=Mycena metata TaxID=1033252 RepID=A0AAD7JIV7_9AGAR|nr:hypothetical protein B0H16DRAFT_1527866 [Mycena metata]